MPLLWSERQLPGEEGMRDPTLLHTLLTKALGRNGGMHQSPVVNKAQTRRLWKLESSITLPLGRLVNLQFTDV